MSEFTFYNGKIHTFDEKDVVYSVMSVKNSKITFLGDIIPDNIKGKRIDLGGKHIYPAFTDSHLHLMTSIVLAGTSFNVCRITDNGVFPNSVCGVLDEIRKYIYDNPKQKLVIVNQYITSVMKEGRLPYSKELDEIASGREIVVYNIDGHSASMTSSLIRKLGFNSDNGILSGKDYDLNSGVITNYVASKVTLRTLIKGLANFQNECAKYGIFRVCALDGDDDVKKDSLLALLMFMARRMTIDVKMFFQYMDYSKAEKYRSKVSALRVGGCSKWELDGSVGSHSAAFYNGYKDTGKNSAVYYDEEFLSSKIREGLNKGYQLSSHAIGTKAIDEICGVYDKNSCLIPESGPMPRIDHFEFCSIDSVAFIKNHRIAITIQPGFSYIDKRYLHSYERYLMDDDVLSQVPVKDLIDSGVCVCGSTDSPVQSVNPFDQMLGMTDFYIEEQSISLKEALKTYTISPAEMLGDTKTGSLKEGKDADFFISSVELESCDNKTLINIPSFTLYIRGKKYKNKKGGFLDLMGLVFKIPHKV